MAESMHKITSYKIIFVENGNEHEIIFETLPVLPQVGDAVAYEKIKGRVEERRFNYVSETNVIVKLYVKQFPEMLI